jgi:hypothetical protein
MVGEMHSGRKLRRQLAGLREGQRTLPPAADISSGVACQLHLGGGRVAGRQFLAGIQPLHHAVRERCLPDRPQERPGVLGRGLADDHHLGCRLQAFAVAEQRRQGREVAPDLGREGGDEGLGALAVGGLAGDMESRASTPTMVALPDGVALSAMLRGRAIRSSPSSAVKK